MPQTPAIDPADLTFEQARDELTAVVDRLQHGTESLQESLDLWERGEVLAKRCEDFLATARERIEHVVAAQSRGPADGPTSPTKSA